MTLTAALGQARTYTADTALVFYTASGHDDSKGTQFATLHDIGDDHQISAGRPIGAREVGAMVAALLNRSERIALLPPTLLAHGGDTLCWWSPPQRRTLWWKVQDDRSKTGNAGRKHPLHRLSGGKFPMPALLWLAQGRQHLSVFALLSQSPSLPLSKSVPYRPHAATKLHAPPFWNISPHGAVCLGDMAMPQELTPDAIPHIEAAFFQSNFTHSNHGLAHQGPHHTLWSTARRERQFPVRLLNQKPVTTLGKLLERLATRTE